MTVLIGGERVKIDIYEEALAAVREISPEMAFGIENIAIYDE